MLHNNMKFIDLNYVAIRVAGISLKYFIAGKRENLLKRYPEYANEINFLVERDPSKRLKYLNWQLQILNSGVANMQEIADVTDLFDKFGQQLDKKDVYQYRSTDFDELKNSLTALRDKKQEKTEKVEELYKLTDSPDAELIYQTDKYDVLLIKNKSASMHHGRDTRWCITSKLRNEFDNYAQHNVVFIFIINKQDVSQLEQMSGDKDVRESYLVEHPYHKVTIALQRDLNNQVIDHPGAITFWNNNNIEFFEPEFKKVYGKDAGKILDISRQVAVQQPKSLFAKFLSREDVTDQEFARIDDEVDLKVLVQLAESTNTPPKLLNRLINSTKPEVAEAASANPSMEADE
jgi:hypothetical protein